MAGEALLGAVVEATISKVIAIADEQINLAWGFKDETEKLSETLKIVNTYLQDAEEKRSTPDVKLWLQGLAKIASEAEDLLEDIRYESLRRQVEVGTKLRKKVSDFFSAQNHILFRIKMANRIKDINASFEDKNSKASQLGLQARVAPNHAFEIRESNSFIEDPQRVKGREVDLSKVIDLLILSSTSGRRLGVVTVVGMPGVGKTELAKLAFNDERLRSHFDEKIWVCVSETFNVKFILKRTLECLENDENVASSDSKQKMLQMLKKKLADKKYLLVLDDVWNRETKKWNELLQDLLDISGKPKECVILATTRDMEVATTMASPLEFRHPLETLKDEECWYIIEETCGIASSSDHFLRNNLETIGRDIARKCKGLPLLAKVIGGTLGKDMNKHAWASIQKNDLWHSLDIKEMTKGVLQLSFDRLGSPCLKKCFAYCSIFRDDYIFFREDLIQLWMAAGFIHPSAHHTAWSIGNQYFNELVSNSLFQDIQRDFYGDVTSCKMHDVVHSFAKSLSEATILTSNAGVPSDVSDDICHLNLDGKKGDLDHSLKLATRRNLRSLFAKFNIFHHNGVEFTRLTILSFVGADVKELPSSIGELKRLTYFDISETAIKEIPSSFTRLYNLETLKLLSCPVNKLPEKMYNLVSLAHLVFYNEELVPVNVGRLTRLQTLPIFVVGSKRSGHGIEELGSLTRLQGKLKIRKLELVGGEDEAKMAKLVEKKELRKLVLEWSSSSENKDRNEGVLEGLQPNPSLKGLEIINYNGHKLPSWLPSTVRNSQPPLENLMELDLESCNNCVKLPSLGRLPNLTHLYIYELHNVRSIDEDFFCNGDFPSLKTLSLYRMRSLEDLMEVEAMKVFPSLEDLKFIDCSKLKGIPWTDGLPSLQRLKIRNCEELRYLRDGSSSFMRLKRLYISRCRNLKCIPSPWGASSLEHLTITECEEVRSGSSSLKNQSRPSLKYLSLGCCPGMSSELEQMLDRLSCLETLFIHISDEVVLKFAQLFTSLKWLSLSGDPKVRKIKSLPHQIQELTSLKALAISDCDSLEDLPECCEKLQSLEELRILNCPNLKNAQCLVRMPQLKVMKITSCFENAEFFPPYLDSIPPSLEELSLEGSELLNCLPSQLQYLSSLKKLRIQSFGRLEDLPEWTGNLSSLERLELYFCKNLMNMPPQQSMQRLSKLKSLIIFCCPKLEERCAKGSGPEWYKISHIPHIEFNFHVVQDI